MGETGLVIDVKHNTAVVTFNRTEACAKCKACMAGFTESEMVMEAYNRVGAKIGDYVIIELKGNAFLAAAAIMYALPLAARVLGIIGAHAIVPAFSIEGDIIPFFSGIALMLITFAAIRLFEKKIKHMPYFMPIITKIEATRKNT